MSNDSSKIAKNDEDSAVTKKPTTLWLVVCVSIVAVVLVGGYFVLRDSDTVDSEIFGSWVNYEEDYDYTFTVTFSRDGTFEEVSAHPDGFIHTESGFFTVSGSSITLRFPERDYEAEFQYRIDDDLLTILHDEAYIVFTRIS
jgi:hypothetical protein